MRLKKIKLAGFKSFVEPTSVAFPSSLVAVVGPNGCGKSNIIDAVRWVMGESSAKNLRGESMADVIFNGSRDRKPVGQAFIELVFENTEGRVLGEFAAYSEIAIKRLVTRDGQSNYYLNGTKCRRKDVTDIFLGTGLGPRSYSIIGQGTISRIIEAKPDELRVFIEEAAGISKYKERRRETENRMRHTKDNLERVQDIRDELGKQLDRLKRQAQAAEKYKTFRTEERLLKAQLLGLRWQAQNTLLIALDKSITENQCQLEALLTAQNKLETDIEQQRVGFDTANDNFNQAQASYYQIGAEIARLEETLAHQKEQKLKLEQELNLAKTEWQQVSQVLRGHSEKIEELTALCTQLLPEVDATKAALSELRVGLEASESQKADWEREWENFNQSASESSKKAHVEQTRIQQLEAEVDTIKLRVSKLQEEKAQIQNASIERELETLTSEQTQVIEAQQKQTQITTEINGALEQSKLDATKSEQELRDSRELLQQLKAKETSLQALQKAALGREASHNTAWLTSNQLIDNKRLAEKISVEKGWEKALEVVLSEKLQALCVEDLNALSNSISEIDKGSISFVQTRGELNASVLVDKPALYQKVNAELPVAINLLSGVYAADDLEQALSWLSDIGKHESIVTKDGLWLGQGWLRINKGADETFGVLAREKLLKDLALRRVDTEGRLNQNLRISEQAKAKVKETEVRKEQALAKLNEVNHRAVEVKAQLESKQERLTQINKRIQAIDESVSDENSQAENCQERLVSAREAWQSAMKEMEADTEKRTSLTSTRETVNNRLSGFKEKLSEANTLFHEKEILLRTTQSELEATKSAALREQSHADSLSERIEALVSAQHHAVDEQAEGSPKQQLEERLKAHQISEQALHARKISLDEIKSQLAVLEANRLEVSEKIRLEQSRLDERRLEKQTVLVRKQTVEETLVEEEQQLESILENMPDDANEPDWERELKVIATRIQRLGAINLAAIDEFDTESERKKYLDEQHNDLCQALETLEAAISKIDKETRTRFKETYDKVNEQFSAIFPRLFGGGQAYLDLTGEDLLDTGVTVMARPPGKRNSTIHLLSGGEKALSAVALVFAIFELNPSPFCMLDEVDAPLDDSNVGRFCALVKDISKKVQFIFITHNKVTMELAQHLLGVTMHEPGVSRIVSVDVEEAVSIAH